MNEAHGLIWSIDFICSPLTMVHDPLPIWRLHSIRACCSLGIAGKHIKSLIWSTCFGWGKPNVDMQHNLSTPPWICNAIIKSLGFCQPHANGYVIDHCCFSIEYSIFHCCVQLALVKDISNQIEKMKLVQALLALLCVKGLCILSKVLQYLCLPNKLKRNRCIFNGGSEWSTLRVS